MLATKQQLKNDKYYAHELLIKHAGGKESKNRI